MSGFSDIRLRWKLLGGFGAVCILMAVVGWLGFTTAQRTQTSLVDIHTNTIPSLTYLSETQVNMLLGQRGIRSAMLSNDPAAIKAFIDGGRKGLEDSDKAFTNIPGAGHRGRREAGGRTPARGAQSVPWLFRSGGSGSCHQHTREQGTCG